jgi:predicted metal-dependent HD superfamily phosphohydrolase
MSPPSTVPRCAAAATGRHWIAVSDEAELRLAWASVAAPTPRSIEVFDDLVGRHRQPHRRYHGLRHVVWVLRHSRRLEAAIAECGDGVTGYDGTAVTAAACFHDAVYDPRADDNEERSAALAAAQLASLGWEAARCQAVAELIGATAGHLADPADGGAGSPWERPILLDADLAVLGSAPAAYDAYVNGVRTEYEHLSASEWTAGRSSVVERLLARSSLYATEPARVWWEERARANLAAELAALSPRGASRHGENGA